MSRCFPFPPPGYEAKPRSEHKDLLKKEKHKEKNKKERKDREKRERKEKDRDHRKDKHNKKHKREKRKDRRKSKERDKEKRQTLEQETQNNDDLGSRRPKERVQNEGVKHSKPTDELVTQIIGQEGHANHTDSGTSKLLPRISECFGILGSKEKERTSLSRVAEKSGQTAQRNHVSDKGKDIGHGSKTRIQNRKSLQVGLAEKNSTRMCGSNGVGLRRVTTSTTQQNGRITPSPNALKKTEQVGQHSNGSSHSAHGKGGSMSTKGMMEKENGSANSFHTRMDQQLVRRGKTGTVQGKAEIKEVKANHHKGVKDSDRDHDVNHKGVKDTGRDRDVRKRKGRGKNKDKEKEKKGVVNELKHKGLDLHGASKNNTHDLMDLAHVTENKLTSDDVKKRKDSEANSSLHEHSTRMTKLPRMSPANLPCVNGNTLKHSQGTVPVGTNTCEADMFEDSKECYNNGVGITGSHFLKEHKDSISSSSYDSNEVSLTPPHPDTKYLSQVYSIPAVDDCSDHIDQDWLFSGDRVHQKMAMFEAAVSPQVWADAQLIDSADIVALPYIVPL